MTRLAITGVSGEMGRTVMAAGRNRDDVDPTVAISRSRNTPVPEEMDRYTPDEFSEALSSVDIIVDFTVPAAAVAAVEAAVDAGVGAVVGTTGFDQDQQRDLAAAADHIPVLVAPNFSRGIQALLAALEETLERLPKYDIEVTETHHNRKWDAPSGTAQRILEVIETARPTTHPRHGRQGESSRSTAEIGVHARRAGSITGEHEVLLAGQDEIVRLCHRAESRAVFAHGALDAASWLAAQSPGSYRFADVITA